MGDPLVPLSQALARLAASDHVSGLWATRDSQARSSSIGLLVRLGYYARPVPDGSREPVIVLAPDAGGSPEIFSAREVSVQYAGEFGALRITGSFATRQRRADWLAHAGDPLILTCHAEGATSQLSWIVTAQGIAADFQRARLAFSDGQYHASRVEPGVAGGSWASSSTGAGVDVRFARATGGPLVRHSRGRLMLSGRAESPVGPFDDADQRQRRSSGNSRQHMAHSVVGNLNIDADDDGSLHAHGAHPALTRIGHGTSWVAGARSPLVSPQSGNAWPFNGTSSSAFRVRPHPSALGATASDSSPLSATASEAGTSALSTADIMVDAEVHDVAVAIAGMLAQALSGRRGGLPTPFRGLSRRHFRLTVLDAALGAVAETFADASGANIICPNGDVFAPRQIELVEVADAEASAPVVQAAAATAEGAAQGASTAVDVNVPTVQAAGVASPSASHAMATSLSSASPSEGAAAGVILRLPSRRNTAVSPPRQQQQQQAATPRDAESASNTPMLPSQLSQRDVVQGGSVRAMSPTVDVSTQLSTSPASARKAVVDAAASSAIAHDGAVDGSTGDGRPSADEVAQQRAIAMPAVAAIEQQPPLRGDNDNDGVAPSANPAQAAHTPTNAEGRRLFDAASRTYPLLLSKPRGRPEKESERMRNDFPNSSLSQPQSWTPPPHVSQHDNTNAATLPASAHRGHSGRANVDAPPTHAAAHRDSQAQVGRARRRGGDGAVGHSSSALSQVSNSQTHGSGWTSRNRSGNDVRRMRHPQQQQQHALQQQQQHPLQQQQQWQQQPYFSQQPQQQPQQPTLQQRPSMPAYGEFSGPPYSPPPHFASPSAGQHSVVYYASQPPQQWQSMPQQAQQQIASHHNAAAAAAPGSVTSSPAHNAMPLVAGIASGGALPQHSYLPVPAAMGPLPAGTVAVTMPGYPGTFYLVSPPATAPQTHTESEA